MNYTDFSNIFLRELARSYRSGQIGLMGLVDFSLWEKVMPADESETSRFSWKKITFNAFQLADKENSLLLIYNVPIQFIPHEAKFVGIRINKEHDLVYYTLRRPKYNDEAWDIFVLDFKKGKEVFLDKIHGTDSLREFKNSIERFKFREEPTFFEKARNAVMFIWAA